MTKIVFATSNTGRFQWLQHELALAGLHDIVLEQRALDLIEIQSMDLAAISLHKAQQAYDLLQTPVVVMDGGFYIDGLNGFPGAYTHDMLDTVGLETMAKIAGLLDDKRCSFRSVATFIDHTGTARQFFDTTGDIFTLTDRIWPTDHPKQWSSLWRMVVPSKFGYDVPLAGLSDVDMTEFLAQRKVFAGPPALQQIVDHLRDHLDNYIDHHSHDIPDANLPRRFVLGFAFDGKREQVVLIEKNRPAFQAGRLNGIGGKIETFDADALDAMRREFFEECGLQTAREHWHDFGRMVGTFGEVTVFCAFDDALMAATSSTDERVRILPVTDPAIRHRAVQNVAVLVTAGLAHDVAGGSYLTIDFGV